MAVILFMIFSPMFDHTPEISYGFFRQQLDKKNIDNIDLQGLKITGEFKDPPIDPDKKDRSGEPVKLEKKFSTTLPAIVGPNLDDQILTLLPAKDKYKVTTPPDPMYFLYMVSMIGLPILMVAGVFFMLRRSQNSIFGGGGILGFSKSPAKSTSRATAGSRSTTWPAWRAKAELQEIVEFLKNPEKFQRLGRPDAQGRAAGRSAGHRQDAAGPGRGRRGGRAVLFSISGSEFIQMFVGVGASRVRDMFKTAKESSPPVCCSSTRSTPWAACAGPASAAAPMSANRRSTRSSARWTASRRPRR